MPYFYQPYTILLVLAVAVSTGLVVSVLKYRPTLGTCSFAVLMSSVGMWSFLSIFDVLSQDPQTKLFSGNLKYLFIVAVPVAWFIFALYYSNRLQRLRPRFMGLLCLIPIITLLMIATNRYHHLMFESYDLRNGNGLLLVSRRFGVWFWFHTAYSYILMFLGFLFLVKSLIDAPRIYRSQVISLLIAALTPWACNMLFLFSNQPLPHLDLTPFAFSLSGAAIMWGIMRYRLLDVVPIARDIVIQNMDDGIMVIDKEQRILDLNPAAAILLGREPSALIGRNAAEAVAWWPHDCATDLRQQPLLPPLIEMDGAHERRLVQVSTTAVGAEKLLGHIIVLRDVTTIKKSQDALRQSEERFKSLSENAPVIILALNDAGIITYVNPAWKIILGHERGEVLGRPFTDFVVENEDRPYAEVFNRLMNGKEHVAERIVLFLHKDGSKRTFDFTAAVNSDEEARITGIIGLAKDITEEERLQAQLFQSQKMEAIGTLAGGVAHDFNNLLMGMQANISLLRLEYNPADPLQEKLKRIEDQIQNGASLTRQLLGYARKGKYVVSVIDIHHLIEDTLNMIQRTNKHIVVQRVFCAQPAFMEADRGQMELVLLNLFVNAIDAMPEGGELNVATRVAPHAELEGWPDISPGRCIEITVADTGTGMDQSTMARIFEPFFTTKEIGRGTGLGLASVYGVVKNHNGHIQASSAVGVGTTFKLLFPASAQSVERSADSPVQAVEAQHPGSYILIIDDESAILEYVGEMVHSLGFRPLLAASGKEGVHVFNARHCSIELVILDMIMPKMDGEEVYQALTAIDPQVRIIIASGSGVENPDRRFLKDRRHLLLKKPFTRDELASAVAAMLEKGAADPQSPPEQAN